MSQSELLNQSEGGTPKGVMKLPGRVMAGGVVPAGDFFRFFLRRRVQALPRPATHPWLLPQQQLLLPQPGVGRGSGWGPDAAAQKKTKTSGRHHSPRHHAPREFHDAVRGPPPSL